MSEVAIFIVGAFIFAITVYGSVMAGGLALTRAEENALPGDVNVEPAGSGLVPPAATAPLLDPNPTPDEPRSA